MHTNTLKKRILLNAELELHATHAGLQEFKSSPDSLCLLHIAALGDNFSATEQLLKLGQDPNAVSPQGATPLLTAARCNSRAVAGLLIEWGANPVAFDAAAETPLLVAAGLGHAGIVKLLLKTAAAGYLEHRDSAGNSALHLAAAGDHLEVVELLVARSANMWALNDLRETPLQVAERNDSSRVRVYLKPRMGEETWRDSSSPFNALILSVLQNRVSDLKQARPDQLALRSPDGKTLLHWAAVRDALECGEYLLGWGLRVDATDDNGNTALHYSALNKADRVCALLLRSGAKVNLREVTCLTPLMLSAISGNESTAKLLMVTDRMQQLDLADADGETALMQAARRGSEGVVRLLIGAGSDVLRKNLSGLSALEISAQYGHSGVTALLDAEVNSALLGSYPRKSPQSGFCVVINQVCKSPVLVESDKLKAQLQAHSHKDVNRLYDLFQGRLHFKVHMRHDLTGDGIVQEITQVVSNLEKDKFDHFVCFIISYGGSRNSVVGTDGRLVGIKEILRLVDTQHCPDLSGKPKIFFFQVSRSRMIPVVPYWEDSSKCQESNPMDMANYKDYLVGHSASEDSVANRWSHSGSQYIQTLCDVIEEYHCREDLLTMMTRVCRVIGSQSVLGSGGCCAMPILKNGLQKKVHL